MILTTKTVTVPDQAELDADQADPSYEGLSHETCAAFGEAACEAGDPDGGVNGTETSATDTIANILHWLADESSGEVEDVLASALSHFAAEYPGH